MLIKINDELWVNPDRINYAEARIDNKVLDREPYYLLQFGTYEDTCKRLTQAEFQSLLEEVNGEEANLCGWVVQVPIEEYNELKEMKARLASLEK